MNKALSVYSKIMWDTVTDSPQKSLIHLGKRDQITKNVSTYSQKIPELKPFKTEPVC
jgi:hypothetical protein